MRTEQQGLGFRPGDRIGGRHVAVAGRGVDGNAPILQRAPGQIRHEHISCPIDRDALRSGQTGVGACNRGDRCDITSGAGRIDGDAAERGCAADKIRHINQPIRVHSDSGGSSKLRRGSGYHRRWRRVSVTAGSILGHSVGDVGDIDVPMTVQRDTLRPGELRGRSHDDGGWRSVAARRGRINRDAASAALSTGEIGYMDVAGAIDCYRARRDQPGRRSSYCRCWNQVTEGARGILRNRVAIRVGDEQGRGRCCSEARANDGYGN